LKVGWMQKMLTSVEAWPNPSVRSPAGDVSDGMGHASTLVSIFCIQPTFNATVDAAGDLPGPGAVSLPGTAQLVP